MTRRPNRLTDAEIGRLLGHMPDPPPPSSDLADRIVAHAIAHNAQPAARGRRRGIGRRIWWAVAILGAAGAVTAAAANAGRFELARVLAWPQEIVRAAVLAPRHEPPVLVRAARPQSLRPVLPAFVAPRLAEQRPLAPLAPAERLARASPPRPERFAGDHPMEEHRPRAFAREAARFAAERRRAALSARRDADRTPERSAFAAGRPVERAEPLARPAMRDDADRAAKDDGLRFHDADAFARRQSTEDRDWRPREGGDERGEHRWAGVGREYRRAADGGDHREPNRQAWQRRAWNRPFHPIGPHPHGRRRG
jgi:hypothetical protein